MTIKTPCEKIVWYLLPAIRKELAKDLIQEFNLSQKETAKKLGLTEAAVSRYVSGKRGGLDILDDETQKEIQEASKRIIKGDKKTVVNETCNICKILQSTDILNKI
jgi:predicted transcriptional regulator